jgi:hypothetical protein
MEAIIKEGVLHITIAVQDPPQPSKSGKTLVVASTHGNLATTAKVDGKAVVIGLNAYIRK